MIKTKDQLKTIIFERLRDKYPVSESDIDFIYPPQQKMGDLALSFPFQLAKKIKANPRQIAQEMLTRLGPLPGVEKMEVAGAGYINLFLDKKDFFAQQLGAFKDRSLHPDEKRIVVEHTNINP
ncbi:MAG: arginine--tRNA ligase, partial [Candidatus Aminicenantes bacterium]|nr:arginine--tRNA ligase [Candidatus Aminicenantes bacterium]